MHRSCEACMDRRVFLLDVLCVLLPSMPKLMNVRIPTPLSAEKKRSKVSLSKESLQNNKTERKLCKNY